MFGSLRHDRDYDADGSLIATRRTTIGGSALVAYDIPLGSRLSLHPRVALGYRRNSRETAVVSYDVVPWQGDSPSGTQRITHVGPFVELSLPVFLQLASHFFVGVGPSVSYDGSNAVSAAGVSGRRTSVGIELTLGGYFGGDAASAVVASDKPCADSATSA